MNLHLRRRSSEALPGDPLGQRLCQIFPYRWQAIAKSNDPEAPWETITRYPLTPRKLWHLWQDAAQIVGVRFGHSTSYAMIDIDSNSPYHPRQDRQAISRVRATLETIGITRTFLTQSSFSGGYHLWLPLPEEVRTFWLAAALKQCLEAQHFVIKQGWLEIFPNCKSYALAGHFSEYQGHRLPLQSATGAQLIGDDLTPILGGLERFFELWDHCASGQYMDDLAQAIHQAEANKKGRHTRRRSSVVQAWRDDQELEIREGWTGAGQTNHLLKTIACYGVVFQGLTGEALITYVQNTATSCPGYTQWCRHQHEITMRCGIWARAAEGYYWSLGTERTRQGNIYHEQGHNPVNSFNQQRSQDAQSRIQAAYNRLQLAGRLPEGKTARENLIVQEARCSKQTTRKYIHLWYPEQRKAQEVCTTDAKPVLSQSSPVTDRSLGSLKPLRINPIHTSPYMKGLAVCSKSESNLSQLSLALGGAGGLSTAKEPSPQILPPQISALPRPQQSQFAIKPLARSTKRGVDTKPSQSWSVEDTKLENTKREVGKLIRQLGWSLAKVKQFMDQALGKSLQALVEDDWILLLYKMRNLAAPS
ncbi:MAG: hypothetical protein HY785_25120 [Oscillatoriophycideae cyanobacterium NC_groundwater_1537_Pr4_S-0.65um_50_18]|nr:hypothetical protein [Oscillatoriophycideae cyanobacterium NC_groundwater_1537_Pr4_S-0.65um_50_18]